MLSAKPLIKPKLPTPAELYFQSIGTLAGTIVLNQETTRYSIIQDGSLYDLHIPKAKTKAWQKFKPLDKPIVYLRVYPRVFIMKDKRPVVKFELVAWKDYDEWGEGINRFVIKGIWQFIPQFNAPVISVYRNYDAVIKTADRCRPTHIPILMHRDDAQPFKHTGDKDGLRWFVSVDCAFSSGYNNWRAIRDISPISQTIPRYRTPIRGINVSIAPSSDRGSNQ